LQGTSSRPMAPMIAPKMMALRTPVVVIAALGGVCDGSSHHMATRCN
jgi:hypothetical protein